MFIDAVDTISDVSDDDDDVFTHSGDGEPCESNGLKRRCRSLGATKHGATSSHCTESETEADRVHTALLLL